MSIAICWRPVPARIGEEHVITRLLRRHCRRVVQTQDASLSLHEFDVILILENCYWFPTILSQLTAMKGSVQRPLLAVWHWEPLPLPKAAGAPAPSLSLREMAKIVLRDVRATDVYTNLAELRRLRHEGWPDLLIVSSRAWQESLAEYGIPAHWVPYGYQHSDGTPLGEHRDIKALFLGALEIPRRKEIIRRLRRRGVDLVAHGSWFDKEFWGIDRTRMINRAQAFLNIQRYPREISAHRLILGIANKSLVVSEPIYRPAPFVSGEHYIEADTRHMPEALDYYCAHPVERDTIVDRAYRFVTEQLTMERSVSRVCALIHEHLATQHKEPDSLQT